MKNIPFVFTSLGTSCLIILIFVFTTVMGQIIYPYGITEDTFITKMGIYLQSFGVLSGILYSLFLTKYPKLMHMAAYVIAISTTAALVFFYIATILENETMVLVASSIIGFAMLPTFFVAYELAVEQTVEDGVTESMSCGLLNTSGMFLSFVIAIAVTPSLNKRTKSSVMWTMITMFIVMAFSIIFLLLGSCTQQKRR